MASSVQITDFAQSPKAKTKCQPDSFTVQKHTLVVLLNEALSTIHPNFHRLIVKSSSGNSVLYHNTMLVQMRHSTAALYFDHKPQNQRFSSRSGRYFDYITHSVSCHVLHLLTPSSLNCFWEHCSLTLAKYVLFAIVPKPSFATSASQLGGPVTVEMNTPCVKHSR